MSATAIVASMPDTAAEDARHHAALSGVPKVDLPSNLRAAILAGRKVSSMLVESFRLQRGPGRLAIAEYLYYRLWDSGLSAADKARFVGKQAQNRMHLACNDTRWYATAADKLLFHTVLNGAGLPLPTLLAITDGTRRVAGAATLDGPAAIAAFLRDPAHYPLFAKPVDGKYSLAVFSADRYDAAADGVRLLDGTLVAPQALAETMAGRAAGFLLQRRLTAEPELAASFGPRLWSVRLLVLITAAGPVIHRAVAKVATGDNPADNFWRHGNMLAAIDRDTGRISRAVCGTGADLRIDPAHPDTGRPLVGTSIPDWDRVTGLARDAARLLPGIRTQSWDIALTDAGPVVLEVNFGGDLNLAQLAEGAGVLDDDYRAHLRACGYRI